MPIRTLDPSDDARHVLDPDRPFNREAMVWVVPLAAEGLGLVAYTWVDAHGMAGTAGIAFGPRLDKPIFERFDDVPVPASATLADWRAGPLTSSLDATSGASTIAYAGDRLAMDFRFEPVHPAYAYSSHPEPFPLFYADDRIEQGGRAQGTATLDGEDVAFDAFGHRDHSWGARAWAGTLHYKWINALAPDVAVHVMDLQGFGHGHVRGYVHRDGTLAEIVSATFDYALDADFYHRRLAATLTDDTGRETTLRMVRPTAEIDYPISPRLQLIDIVGEAEVEGVPAVGYAEMAWPPDYVAANVEEQAHTAGEPA